MRRGLWRGFLVVLHIAAIAFMLILIGVAGFVSGDLFNRPYACEL